MTRPESAPGFTLWLAGLSGAGKVDTELDEPQACADQMIAFLESRGLVR